MLRTILIFIVWLFAATNAAGQGEIKVRVCSFAEVTKEVYESLGKEAALKVLDTIAAQDSRVLGNQSPLSDSFARLLSHFLTPLPKRRVISASGGETLVPAVLEDTRARGFFHFSSEDGFVVSDLVLVGIFVRQGEGFYVSLYLASKEKEHAELLGSTAGSISRLEDFAPAMGPLALRAISNRDILIRDFRTDPRASALSLAGTGFAEISGTRIFIERGKIGTVEVGSGGYLSEFVALPGYESKAYAQVEVRLRLDPTAPKASIQDILSGAEAAVGWDSKKEYLRASKDFESALGRLLISIPISALGLGGFFLSYESYTRLGTSSASLYASAALAGASLAATALCIVDVGFRMARKIKIAR
ncbi:MAG: hypothetical protein FD137_947 [Spirochaetes bacterium]|nr:MAG: hypothetical protein FD137_947 [Spirochaetota bacterium]